MGVPRQLYNCRDCIFYNETKRMPECDNPESNWYKRTPQKSKGCSEVQLDIMLEVSK